MSEKFADKLIAVQTLGMIPKGELITFPSGGQVKQVTLNFTSGKRMRLNEGQLGFIDALSMRPGDVIQFDFDKIDYGTFKINKDQPNEKTVAYQEFLGVNGKLQLLEIGEFSDKPCEELVKAGRQAIDFSERIIAAKDTVVPPPALKPKGDTPANTTTDGGTVTDGDSPFGVEE